MSKIEETNAANYYILFWQTDISQQVYCAIHKCDVYFPEMNMSETERKKQNF